MRRFSRLLQLLLGAALLWGQGCDRSLSSQRLIAARTPAGRTALPMRAGRLPRDESAEDGDIPGRCPPPRPSPAGAPASKPIKPKTVAEEAKTSEAAAEPSPPPAAAEKPPAVEPDPAAAVKNEMAEGPTAAPPAPAAEERGQTADEGKSAETPAPAEIADDNLPAEEEWPEYRIRTGDVIAISIPYEPD
ncbi:MAG: hypothetical protein N3A66_10195, partial [Planctomycetota bacterium]|nr:hypothetical protein [Planctomycetota bacterium]